MQVFPTPVIKQGLDIWPHAVVQELCLENKNWLVWFLEKFKKFLESHKFLFSPDHIVIICTLCTDCPMCVFFLVGNKTFEES